MSSEPLPSVILVDDGRVELLPLDNGLPVKPDGYEGREIHATRGARIGDALGFVYSRRVLTAAEYDAVEAFLDRERRRRGKGVSALEMYLGKCPDCGDPGPHVLTQTLDTEPPTVTCRKCKHVWPRGSERSNPGGPAGYIDW